MGVIEVNEKYEYWGHQIEHTVYECDGDCDTCDEYCDNSLECSECGEHFSEPHRDRDGNEFCPKCGSIYLGG